MFKRAIPLLLVLTLLLTGTALAQDAQESGKYRLSDEPVTIDYFISNNYQTDFNETHTYFIEREKMTNVHVNWIIVSGSDYATRKTLM
ncbi:MAG TPA: hypothetical protein PKE04_08660 [Clostridia bacterium]|nr:hypothetical protein [Clostridia bacterium]